MFHRDRRSPFPDARWAWLFRDSESNDSATSSRTFCLSSGEAESVGDDVAHGQIHFGPYQESCRCCCTNNPSQRIAIIHDNFQFNSKSECQLRCTTISLWFIALFKSPRWINWRKLVTGGVRCCKEIVMEMELITSGANYRRPSH